MARPDKWTQGAVQRSTQRTTLGPFVAPGAAGVTAASQTNLDCRFSHVAAAVIDYVAPRAGFITAISGALDTAATGAGTTIVASVTVNGTELVAGPTATFTADGAEVVASGTVGPSVHTFDAGDTIGVSYTSTGISNTPKLVCTVELES